MISDLFMGHYGPPSRASAPSPTSRGRSALSSLGRVAMTPSGGVRVHTRRRKSHHRGYRMPAIVKQQIEHNMRFQDQLIVALIAGATHK